MFDHTFFQHLFATFTEKDFFALKFIICDYLKSLLKIIQTLRLNNNISSLIILYRMALSLLAGHRFITFININ